MRRQRLFLLLFVLPVTVFAVSPGVLRLDTRAPMERSDRVVCEALAAAVVTAAGR